MPTLKFVALLSTLIASLIFSASSISDQKGVYRWTDDQGNQHYSDKPPKGTESEFIKTATGRTTEPAPQDESANPEAEQGQAPPASMEVVPEKDPTVCKQAKGNLQALSGRPRVRIKEANGEYRYLSEEEKETQRELARKNIEVHCN